MGALKFKIDGVGWLSLPTLKGDKGDVGAPGPKGDPGPGNVSTVNDVEPDANGNLTLTPQDVGALPSTTPYAGSGSVGGAATDALKADIARGLFYGITSDSTTAMTVTIDGITEYYPGLIVILKMGAAPASGCTVNINGLGAKVLRYGANKAGAYFTSGAHYLFVYDGTYLQAIHSYDGNSDIKMRSYKNEAGTYPVLASRTQVANITSSYAAIYGTMGAGITMTPSENKITADRFEGNADTATKADQDSAGQQIDETYIKGLSVSGKVITYTKGDGTTGTITTQDTNTTYGVATPDTNGLMSATDKANLDGIMDGSLTPTYTQEQWEALTTEQRVALYGSGVRMIVVTENTSRRQLICLNADGTVTIMQNELTTDNPLALSAGGTGASTAAQARNNLGVGQVLENATWSSGSITIPGVHNYKLFTVYINWLPCVGIRTGDEIMVYGLMQSTASTNTFGARITINSEDDCTLEQTPTIVPHNYGTSHGSIIDGSINMIIGII